MYGKQAMAKQWSPEERRLHRKRLKERIKEQEEQEKRWEEARLLEVRHCASHLRLDHDHCPSPSY